MRNIIFCCFVVSFLVSLSVPAYAQKTSGFGISAGLGVSQIKDEDGSVTFQGNGFGASLDFEYRFNERFAAGIGFFTLGTAEDTINSVDTEIDAGGLDFFGRLIFPISDNVEGYGRFGWAVYDADVDPGLSTSPFGQEAFEIGGGVDFHRTDNFAFRLEARYFNGKRDESGGLITAGFNYRF